MTIEHALEQLDNRRCPIDGLPVAHDADVQETEQRFDQCERGHTWPYCRDGKDWIPDAGAVAERLEEYED